VGMRRRPRSAHLLAGFMTVAGAAHFVIPRSYEALIPSMLGSPRAWIYGSGVVELICAAGLALPRTRRATAWATAGLFVAVFPGNMTMALNSDGRAAWYEAAAVGRLPLQIPLVWWAVSVARDSGRRSARTASPGPPAAG
jgi:uncharacterized membrane protein